MTTKTRPVHEIRLGRIKAAIWGKQAEGQVRYDTTFARLYKDEAKGWHDSSGFGREDLLVLAKVSDMALDWIQAQVPEGAEPSQEAEYGSSHPGE